MRDTPEQPECDFTQASQIVALTQCAHCLHTIPQSLALTFNGEHYCDEECAENEFALEKLRACGL